jgi:oryzin
MTILAALPAAFTMPTMSPGANVTVPGKYIVTLKPNVKPPEMDNHMAWVADIHSRSISRRDLQGVDKVWEDTFKGYSGEFDDQTLKEISESDEVSFLFK